MLILSPNGFINSMFQRIMLTIDSVIYWLASLIYKLFFMLSTAKLFEDNFFSDFAKRIYAIIGVFMLFYLAYALLNALVDPDKFSKGDKSVSKMAGNLVISLVLIGLFPSLFTYAYRLQNYILSTNLIGSVVFGTKVNTDFSLSTTSSTQTNSITNYGNYMTFIIMNAFINPDNYNEVMGTNYNWYDFKYDAIKNGDFSKLPDLADNITYGKPILDSNLQASGNDVKITYMVFISSLAGAYLVWILGNFVLDLGVRVVKLAFCQLIAPLPIIMRILPSKKGTFDKWLKLTLSTYADIFIRVLIIYISIYFINGLVQSNVVKDYLSGGVLGVLALAIVIMGILTFAKQAPKLIGDVLGIDTSNLKLGIGEKLKAGGFFAGGALVGAAATGIARNGIHGIGNIGAGLATSANQFKNSKGFLGHTGAIIGGFGRLIGGTLSVPGSMLAGGTSGAVNAWGTAKSAKGLGDMAKSAGTGADKSTANREKRASYIASHGGFLGSMAGHISDVGQGVGQWAGITPATDALQKRVSVYEKGVDFKKQLEDIAKRKCDEAKLYDEQVNALNSSIIKPEDFKTQDDYYTALNHRANQITDLKNKRDIAIAKKVVDMTNNLDNNLDVQAVINSFDSFKKENAGMEGIDDLASLTDMKWDDSWNDDASTMKKELNYLANNKSMLNEKNKATSKLNERIVAENKKSGT